MGNKRKSFRQEDGSIPVQSMTPTVLPVSEAPDLKGKLGENDEWLREQLTKNLEKTGDADYFNVWTGQTPTEEPEQMSEAQLEQTDGQVPDSLSDETVAVESTSDQSSAVEETPFDYASFRSSHGVPDSWTDEHIDLWIATGGNLIEHTERGSIVNDVTRKERDISTWGVDEILDGFSGLLTDVGENQFGALAKAYRQLVSVDAAWSVRDLIDFLTQGLEPSKTSNGAWRNDVTRARRPANEWTTQELVAWALGEIRAIGETNDQKVSTELNKRLDLCAQSNKPEDVIRAYKKMQSNSVKVVGVQPTATTPEPTIEEPVVQTETVIPQGLTAMNAAYLKTQTERYLKACAPGVAITPEIGAKEQRELDNLFRYILKLEDPAGFGSAMTYFRDFYKKHRDGLFEPTYAGRFTGTLRTEGDLQETHINLLAIFHVYTDPDKAARKQVDLPFLLRKFPANRQGWLLEFFQRYC